MIEYLPIVFIIVLIAIGLSPVIMYEIQSRRKKDKEDDSSEE